MSKDKKCELIHDEYGWWMQYVDGDGKKRVTLLDADSETEAELAALDEGYRATGIGYV
jgi:hypothetical protein